MAGPRWRAGSTIATVATVVLAALCVVATVVWKAPANWLASYLQERTQGVVLLADADGTIWAGSAVVALGAPGGDTDPRPARSAAVPAIDALALPGRVTWTLEITGGLAPVLHLTHDGVLLQPLAVRIHDGGLVLDGGAIALPASMLKLAGAPLNTLLPEGRCELRWSGLRFAGSGPPTGEGTLRIASFALAISPVRPLGDYLLSWSSGERGLAWQIATEHGPLQLEGGGSMAGRRNQARIVVRVAPDAPAGLVAQLNPLLDMLGRRGTDEAIVQTGSRT